MIERMRMSGKVSEGLSFRKGRHHLGTVTASRLGKGPGALSEGRLLSPSALSVLLTSSTPGGLVAGSDKC